MADVEVRAAHNVLEACARTETIDKVVFTSSVTAVVWSNNRSTAAATPELDERHWTDVNFCRKVKVLIPFNKVNLVKNVNVLAFIMRWAILSKKNYEVGHGSAQPNIRN